MTQPDHVLAIDCGTQSVRAHLFDPTGHLVASARVELEAYVSPRPGWAEQDPQYYWESLTEACRKLWQVAPVPRDAVAGLALTTQRSTVINLDSDGKVLRPAIVWLDQRRTDNLPALGALWRTALRMAGMRETIDYLMAEAEANWIRTEQPEVWRRTAHYLFLSGFLTWKLVGRFVDSVGCQVGYVPFDYRRLRWAGPRDWKWQAIGVDPDWLPELVPPGDILGEVSQEASDATGIPVGLPVVAAAADKACEVLGSGCIEPQIACLSYGTCATINTTQKNYVEATRFIPPFPAAVGGLHTLEVQVYRGFWMVSWFKQEFGDKECRLAAERGMEPEELFDELVEAVEPGSMGLVLQPYWSPGIKRPGPEAKGAIIGFGDVHTRAHVYRAILEGIAYALREGNEQCQRRTGVQIEELRVAGGGSKSDAAMQITADVFGLPSCRPHVSEASGLGAAIDAAVGLGLHPNFETAVEEMTHVGRVFEPDPERQATYDSLYNEVYLQMYRRLRPLYERIRSITGYPRTSRR
ncbi:MAG: carbohydrate kinase [bacterium]|nr:carbohydrate kinase [bacterium]